MPWRVSVIVLIVIISVAALQRFHERGRSDRLRLTFFDVGQGDAALVEFPGGTTWLVDAGGGFGEYDTGERVLFPELARLGVLSLDVAFLTHPDADHAFGFRGIFKNLEVREFWMSQAVRDSENPLLGRLLKQSAVNKVTARAFRETQRFEIGGARADVIPLHAGDSTNDEPLLLRVEFGGCSAFLAADAEQAAEAAVTARHPRPVDLLKVAHHGSKTSSHEAFLKALSPRWAVISVGEGNSYHHPHPLAVGRLRRAGVRLLRTDFHGFVRFSFSDQGEALCEYAAGECGRANCRILKP